jgi:hypothetical protein
VNVDLNLESVKNAFLDIWEDLGRTRLAGVAVGLTLALLAITVIVLRPAGGPETSSADYPAAPTAVPANEIAFTVPGKKPMRMSDVELSAPRDPFRSLDGLDASSSSQTLIAAGDSVQDAVTASTSSGAPVTTGSDATSSLLPINDLPTDSGTADSHGHVGDLPLPPDPHAPLPPDPHAPHPPVKAPVTDYSYTVDIQFGLVDDLERYASVQRLGLVPSRQLPLLMYLGVSTDHKTAVFMVDSRLSQGGEGECVPKESLCTFLELESTPDRDEHHFRDADGNEYLLRLRRIVRTTASAGSVHGRSVSELDGSPSVVDGAR